MTMPEALPLLGAGIAGFLLGTVFYGGLWWTVHKAVVSRRPALWMFCSLFVRMGMALAGFYLVGNGQWQRLVACLLGFLVARLVVTWRLPLPGRETGNAT